MKRLLCLSFFMLAPVMAQPSKYPFNDPSLPSDRRIANLLSLMTIDEKIACLGARTAVPRLDVPNIGSSEGIHGVVQREARGPQQPITTTQFPQPPGMGETWDPDLVRQAAGVRGLRSPLHHPDRQIQPPDPHAMGTAVRPCPRSPLGPQRRSLRRRSVLQRHHGSRLH